MTMCPYKWFLYIASVWALVYVSIEAWIQWRNATRKIEKPGYEHLSTYGEDSDSEEEEEEEIGTFENKAYVTSVVSTR